MLTKSATKEGMLHLRMAELPRMTFSMATSIRYCWGTTWGRGRGVPGEGANYHKC